MANTSGFVQLASAGTLLGMCFNVGPAPTNTELLSISIAANDSAAIVAYKTSMSEALFTAMVARRSVTVTHGDTDGIISAVSL
jgi:hypothetical protein